MGIPLTLLTQMTLMRIGRGRRRNTKNMVLQTQTPPLLMTGRRARRANLKNPHHLEREVTHHLEKDGSHFYCFWNNAHTNSTVVYITLQQHYAPFILYIYIFKCPQNLVNAPRFIH